MQKKIKTLLIDNYDSFTFNLYQLLGEVNGEAPVVIKNDAVEWNSFCADDFDNIVISPGPGRPERRLDFGISSDAILSSSVPILGVCLGHQGIAHCFGGAIGLAPSPVHGQVSEIFHSHDQLFSGLESPFRAVRYHSLAVNSLPEALEQIAWTSDGIIMGIRHRKLPIWGIQFHPESICTLSGIQIIKNFHDLTKAAKGDTLSFAPHRVINAINPPAINLDPCNLVVATRKLHFFPDPLLTFRQLFADSPNSFWLDGGSSSSRPTGFSFMGDDTGPMAELVEHRVSEMCTIIKRHGKILRSVQGEFFDFLECELKSRHITDSAELPFDFNLGYVGYMGYELKSECGGACVHESPDPDVRLLFADRIVVFDWEQQHCYLLCLANDSVEAAEDWFRKTADALAELPTYSEEQSQERPLDRSTRNTNSGAFRHDRSEYIELINKCLREITHGESYEICLTNQFQQKVKLDPLSTYAILREINPAPYSAYFGFSDFAILSSSPERFLRVDTNGRVESKPIKGTRKRAKKPADDEALRLDLKWSKKDQAENLMIVDLVRNDLNSVCQIGSVHVPKLFDIESFASVHQMVSTIRGTLRQEVSTVKCVKAAFPGGSMTGAPKLRTMAIIDKLERGPRGVYSGSIGFFALNGTADLSIVIRTLIVRPDEVCFGVGGAIVADSDAEEEFLETLIKAEAIFSTIEKATQS